MAVKKTKGLQSLKNIIIVGVFLLFAVAYYTQFSNPNILNDLRQRASGPSTSTAAAPSVVLNQTAPAFGSSINFTAVYPKEATRKVGVDQHWNPDVQVSCVQNGTLVLSQVVVFLKDSQNGDGNLTGISSYVTLSANGGNGITWTGGAANCSATLYYFGHDFKIHTLAGISFTVSQ